LVGTASYLPWMWPCCSELFFLWWECSFGALLGWLVQITSYLMEACPYWASIGWCCWSMEC
jgi:hypothetical protein